MWAEGVVGRKAVRDSRLLADPRVLKNFLKLEETCVPKTPDYIRNCQPELNPSMRKIVTDWMLQVYLIFRNFFISYIENSDWYQKRCQSYISCLYSVID